MSSPIVSPAPISSSELGLLCAFFLPIDASESLLELAPPDLEAALARRDGVTWLHFNLSNARARQLIANMRFLPEELRDVFASHDLRRRVELVQGGILAVISDLTYEEGSDPAEVAPLWSYTTDCLLMTGRTRPLHTLDKLRAAVRTGLRVGNALELFLWMFSRRTSSLRDISSAMSEQVSEIEDEILGGRIREQREQLGRIRRFCAQLRRHFGPDRIAYRRLLQSSPGALRAEDFEAVRTEVEELSFLIDEVLELYERSKLLQEELASRVAEETGRSLYVLAILSAVFLPMTLITGVFGMNVAGLPGLRQPSSFWWVLGLIVGAGIFTLAMIFRRKRR
jgi:zinc transporter